MIGTFLSQINSKVKRSKKSKVGEILALAPGVPVVACSVEQTKVEAPMASTGSPATVGCTCGTSTVGNLVTLTEPTTEPPKPKRKRKRTVKKKDNSMAVLAGLGTIALLGAALLKRA